MAILEIYKNNEILVTSGILFLFIVDTYKTNKLRHMRPLNVWLYWRYLTFSPKDPNSHLEPKAARNIFIPKITLKPVADIVFDLKNEFHANRISFGDFG